MSIVPVPDLRPPGASRDWSFLCITFASGFAAAFLFALFPEVDIAVSRLFYLGAGKFLFDSPGIGAAMRTLLRIGFALVCIASVAGFVSLAFLNRRLFGLGLAAWGYIALCAAVGPGVVANLGFKDHWHRARPVHIVEFGGTKQFTPPMLRTDQCAKNCSFISGEAANYYAMGFAFAFLMGGTPARRRQFFLAAIAAGSFAGLIRIGGGGHFLSDVIFAGIFMALVAYGLAWLVLKRWAPHLEDGGRFHQSTLRLGKRIEAHALRLWNAARQRISREGPTRRPSNTPE